jgi:hypothetical protein
MRHPPASSLRRVRVRSGAELVLALYRVFIWADIEPIYGKPWAESIKKAAAARRRNEV